ncbi:MAG: capsule assembly Wzi family protein, partial [Holophaga sp.]|nr:capsule assembly Wzi family protein [Holophaga sp.]
MKWGIPVCLAILPLSAQTPPGWNHPSHLGREVTGAGVWTGAGFWAGDHHGPAPTLVDSLGLGNGLTGGGFHLEGGFRDGPWDFAAEVLGNRNTQGQAYLTLYRSHLWYRGERGWQGGFEQEPLVWGYGLNGGYLLGEAARPFPRLRVESPMADLHLGRVPFGSWGWQAFMGRMENHPVLSSSIQDPSARSRALARQGNPEAPLLMGYRVQAQFGPAMEFYLNYLNLWSGTLNGRGLTGGYNLGNYATAVFGLKDSLTEANIDYSNPGTPTTSAAQAAHSASEIDVGFRLRAEPLARVLGADDAHLYVSRGSKSELWPVAVFLKNPLRYGAKDFSKDFSNLVTSPNLGAVWGQNSRYTAPSLSNPNDTVGLLVSWPGVRAGLEYFDGVNSAGQGNRPFAQSVYLTGFYSYGDPLGEATGGEAVTTTAKLELDLGARLTSATWLVRGFRPFRDDPV